jgi:hypothetical protein
MTTIGNESRPAYVYDADTDTWVPIGVGPHTHDEYIDKTIITAKGDIIVGTATEAVERLGVGPEGSVLIADPTSSTGLAWGEAGGSITVSTTAPEEPGEGDLWFNSTNATTYIYYDGFWVEQSPAIAGPKGEPGVVASASEPSDTDVLWLDTDEEPDVPVPAGGTTGQVLAKVDSADYNTQWVTQEGYRFVQTLYYTSSGTFTKATYSWLRAIRVKCQAGGGGGAGAATTGASTIGSGGGGAGGVYAESFITDIAGLDSSITVTRGAGGAGGAAGNNAGSAGGSSSFGSLVSATGGLGGGPVSFGGSLIWNSGDQSGPTTGTGNLVIPGGSTKTSISLSFTATIGSIGGDSFLGTAAPPAKTFQSNQGFNGLSGLGFGSGGNGGQNAENTGTARAGGTGGNGIVIVELYA